jgi:hypothetical protein
MGQLVHRRGTRNAYTILSENFSGRNDSEGVDVRFNIKPDVREMLCTSLNWIQLAQNTVTLMSRKVLIL